MQNLKSIFTVLILFISFTLKAQIPNAVQDYINTYKGMAIAEMQRTGVPAAIKLAQGIIETEAGQSVLVNKSNNHFGIKCKSNWTGESVSHDDDARGECFRKYNEAVESYRDHSNFLKSNQRYAFLFDLDPTDFEGWANGLKKAGYATNPKYPSMLIKVINENNLQDYSLIALGKKVPDHNIVFASSTEPIKGNVIINSASQNETGDIKINTTVAKKTYPTGEFKINDLKVVYLQKGSSFLALALSYDMPLSRLFEFNEMKEQEMVNESQLVFLQRKHRTGSKDFHIVEKEENLYKIAQAEGIRLQNLLEYNSLSENQIPAEGEKLYLKTKSPVMPKLLSVNEQKKELIKEVIIKSVSKTENEDIVVIKEIENNSMNNDLQVHTVQHHETLYSISKIYNVGVLEIHKWNSLKEYELKPGQQLKIFKTGTNVSKSKDSR